MHVSAVLSLLLMVYGLISGSAIIQNYLQTQLRMLSSIEEHLHHRSRQMNVLDNRLSEVLSQKHHNFDTIPLGHSAVSSMVTVQRLAKDWAELAAITGRYTALSSLGLGGVRWPGSDDVKAAVLAVYRIQKTYSEESKALSQLQGNISQHYSNSGMTALDCFNIALHHYNYGEPDTFDWLQLSLDKIRNGDTSIPKELVMAYKSAETCSLGDSLTSALVLSEILKELPKYNLPSSLIMDFQDIVSRGCGGHIDPPVQKTENQETEEWKIHKNLCKASERLMEGMRCRYVHYQQPHLRFQPFKLEELQLDPPILRFYDVITDNEVASLKEISKTRMNKAKTLAANGDSQLSDYRTSHVAWVYRQESNMTQTLQHRIADITRMNLSYAEPHQVSRYGVGGEYKPHQDSLSSAMFPYEYDRLATLMFYLNDVPQGGSTIFLNWNLTVAPVKNSAILWFHFLPSGEEDMQSFHSGCPVIEGEKWVMNKWIHNIGNEFTFQCGLNKNASYMEHYL